MIRRLQHSTILLATILLFNSLAAIATAQQPPSPQIPPWLTGGGAAGPRVVDANGNEVGFPSAFGGALAFIDGHWLSVAINPDGFQSEGEFVFAQFTLPDCGGVPVFGEGSLSRTARVLDEGFGGTTDGTLLYAGDPITMMTPQSVGFIREDLTIFECLGPTGGQIPAGPVVRFDLSTLGLVAPFEIVR